MLHAQQRAADASALLRSAAARTHPGAVNAPSAFSTGIGFVWGFCVGVAGT